MTARRIRAAIERVEAADLPDELDSERDDFLDAMRRELTDLSELVAGSRAGDADQMKAALKKLVVDRAGVKTRGRAIVEAITMLEDAL